jgi:quinoprotein glucose dehydrogenase
VTPNRQRSTAFIAAALLGGACTSPDAGSGAAAAPDGSAPAADAVDAGDWAGYARDLAGTRFSPLAEIDADNVADLKLAWTFSWVPTAPPRSPDDDASQTTPLVVAGILYLATADRLVAVRAESGAEVWSHALGPGTVSRRGLAYWPGDDNAQPRVYVAIGGRLLALDAATGRAAADFGAEGEIAAQAPPDAVATRAGRLLLVGSERAPLGLRAFDAQTGTEVWSYKAADDTPTPSAGPRAPWSVAVDADRGLVYASFASGAAPGTAGPAADDVVVALELRTGQPRWRFEAVHGDRWGYDLPGPPLLLDVEIAGRPMPVVAELGDAGYLYLLQRATGEPLLGADARASTTAEPAAAGPPGQPVPPKPPPLARVSYAPEDIVAAADTTAEHARRCKALRDAQGGLRNAGPFTAYAERAARGGAAALVFPGPSGAAGWGGLAADPSLRLLIANTADEGGFREPRSDAEAGFAIAPFAASGAASAADGAETPSDERAWPCQKPPWGRLSAVNAATGDVAWSVPLGVTASLPESRRQTGRPNVGGAIATAGGLVLIGAADDRRLRAFDTRSGQELWSEPLPRSAHATPITYLAAGKQYIAVVAAGSAPGASSTPDRDPAADAPSLRAYALP